MILIILCISFTFLSVSISGPLLQHIFTPEPRRASRHEAIDGLRGYLAISVMISHFAINLNYQKTGVWASPSVTLSHFGDAAVILFFMITAFLFYGKIVKGEGTDFASLYKGRLLRICPLFMIVVSCVIVIALIETSFTVTGSYFELMVQVGRWLLFLGMPDINGFVDTFRIISGVAWTLPYEWFFYFLLPALALIQRILAHARVFRLVSIVTAIFVLWILPDTKFMFFRTHMFLPFLFGMLAYEFTELRGVPAMLRRKEVTALMAAIAFFSLLMPMSSSSMLGIILLFAFFLPTACGNSFVGIFNTKSSKIIGDSSYSIYLLHGLVLYVCFMAIDLKSYGNNSWLLLPFLGFFVVVISSFSYFYIEKYFIDLGRGGVVKRIRAPVA